jgi:DNA-binding transcriptional ArsR family regulator
MLELLVEGEQAAGAVVERTRRFAPISQPAVSQHLRVLREAGLVTVRADGTRRLYALDADGLRAARDWLAHLVDPMAGFGQPLDALETEVARGRRAQRTEHERRSSEGVERRPGRSA